MKVKDKVQVAYGPYEGETGVIYDIESRYTIHTEAGLTLSFSKDELEKVEDVTNPSHYHQGGIDVLGFSTQNYPKEQVKGFHRINIMKYIHRYDKKNGIEDLIKAKDYLERLIELENDNEQVQQPKSND